MNKIKIRAASWSVYADDGTERPSYLGSIFRVAHQGFFIVFPQRAELQSEEYAFDTFAEARAFFESQVPA